MKIGVCGTGRMGAAIAQRLIAVGHEVGVWNRDSKKTKPLTDAGAKLYASPAELVEGCEAVIAMLLNDAATEAVYRGPQGILKSKPAGKLIIDMSTVRPDTMISVGTAVAQQAAAFVECPVGGSTVPAREGKLFGLVGGTDADVTRAMPLLEQLCRRIEHVGVLGSGATMKLAVNLPLLVYWQALGESLTICKPLNLPAERRSAQYLGDTAFGIIQQLVHPSKVQQRLVNRHKNQPKVFDQCIFQCVLVVLVRGLAGVRRCGADFLLDEDIVDQIVDRSCADLGRGS